MVPKYVFLFIGDGMSYPQIQATAYFNGAQQRGEESTIERVSFMDFPVIGSQYTYDSTSFCPDSASGIMAAIVLGLGRAIGETMAVVMVAGNMPIIPDSLLSGVRTMTANIVLEMGYAADLHREALIACGVVLFVFILLINLCFSAVKRKADAT